MYQAVVIGGSAGGLHALFVILEELPADYPIPIIVVQHRTNDYSDLFEQVLQYKSKIRIKQADEKEEIRAGVVYVAPPGYHLLVESDETFSLSSDMRVKYSMPSIDVLFESAAQVFNKKLVGIILTGASNDGSAGITAIKNNMGLTIAQHPEEAQFPYMPQSAIDTGAITFIWTVKEIQQFLKELPLKLSHTK
ncbi:MAG: chemotaxis protein CheB [Cyclobacteriaceae bacterium]